MIAIIILYSWQIIARIIPQLIHIWWVKFETVIEEHPPNAAWKGLLR